MNQKYSGLWIVMFFLEVLDVWANVQMDPNGAGIGLEDFKSFMFTGS